MRRATHGDMIVGHPKHPAGIGDGDLPEPMSRTRDETLSTSTGLPHLIQADASVKQPTAFNKKVQR